VKLACAENYLDHGVSCTQAARLCKEATDMACTDVPTQHAKSNARIIDLDVEIGADTVDYKYAVLFLACIALHVLTWDFLTAPLLTMNHCRVLRWRCISLKGLSRRL
jgi:hypothetical protein